VKRVLLLTIQKFERCEMDQELAECIWAFILMPVSEEVISHIMKFDDFPRNKKHSIEDSEANPKRRKK
jgi:hypothetical protein